METKKEMRLSKLIFAIYLFILAKLMIFRGSILHFWNNTGTTTLEQRIQSANFIPFHTIKMYLDWGNPFWTMVNVPGNIIVLVPFGIFLPLLFKGFRSFFKTSIFSLFVILGVEVFQLYKGIGEFDIDDIILNVIGAMAGYVIWKVFFRKTE